MKKTVKVGLIGDYNSSVRAHIAIPNACALAAHELNIHCSYEWIGTEMLEANVEDKLSLLEGLWCVPASPYKSMEGALNGIYYARENLIPFLGTCGGFQHTVIEYVRNVLGKKDADHAESNPDADFQLISPLSCSMVGTNGKIFFAHGSRICEIYNSSETTED